MPKPNFPLVNPEQVEAEIKTIIGQNKLDDFNKKYANYLEDFCRMGVLMTDAGCCYKALTALNSLLLKKLSKTATIPLKKPLTGSPELGKTDGKVKHFGLLSNFFKAWEEALGFNAAQNLPLVPSKPQVPANTVPTLTGFVSVDKFRTHLFAPGYHWKDPAVGYRHGEFTHRIQWYIVTQVNVWDKILKNKSLEVFKMFADDLCKGVGPKADKTVWDAVFDRNTPNTDFRSPEFMHTWFKDLTQQEDENVGILSQLIAGRALKRNNEKFTADKLKKKQRDNQIDVKAREKEGDIFWYTTKSSKIQWEKSDLEL